MKQLFLLFICSLLLLACTSCIFDNSDAENEKEFYLNGTIIDAEGNAITDASVYILFDNVTGKRDTLPVELSIDSFGAAVTGPNTIKLTWVTESESDILGYNLYRSNNNNFDNSYKINPYIIAATNTAQQQTYSFIDYVTESGTYYYWLESIEYSGTSYLYGPVSATINVDPPVIPINWAMNNAYPNPTNGYSNVSFSVPQPSHISVVVKSAYSGTVRTLIDENKAAGMYHIIWDGYDSSMNRVCNGVYEIDMIATSVADSVRYRNSCRVLFNDVGLHNKPAVFSTVSGYKIPLNKYFQFGKEIIQTDVNGNELGEFTIDGDFTICIKKQGYQTYSRHISLSTIHADRQEDFVLQALVK